MAPPEGNAGDLCIWFVTCFFFLLILSGGIFLVFYITLPETGETAWLPVAGMILIAIPWIFWILTCFYRTVIPCYRPAPVPAEELQLCSPGGGRRVRFGAATVIGPQDGGDGADGEAGAVRNAEGSSLGSHESEVPLALSLS